MVQHTDATTIATLSLWDVNHPESACSLVAWFADFTPLLSVCLLACLLAMEAWKALKGGRQAVLNRTIIGAVSVHMCLRKHLGVCAPFLNTLTSPSPDKSPHSQILFC